MKYAGKTFTLYASQPVAVQGSDSLYTYQNTGTGTATLQGSNNGKDWVTITTVTSGASSISSHSYAFLRMTGSTEVSVSRGEAGSGSTLLNGSEVSSSNPLPVAGRTVRNAATFARPADTTAYAALDTVSTSTSAPVVITFSSMARINAGSGYITKARIMTDQKTNTARYRLHLFHTAPTLTNDNAAFPLLWADRANRVGKIDFGAMTTEDATNSTCAESLNEAVRLSFTCEAANTALYGILETLDAFTPASGQNFYISLTSEQN